MPKDKFVLGIDYGTESGRAVVVRVRDGKLMSSALVPYPDGVIDERLPGGPKLEPDWALQNPLDYLYVLEKAVPKALKEAKVKGRGRDWHRYGLHGLQPAAHQGGRHSALRACRNIARLPMPTSSCGSTTPRNRKRIASMKSAASATRNSFAFMAESIPRNGSCPNSCRWRMKLPPFTTPWTASLRPRTGLCGN